MTHINTDALRREIEQLRRAGHYDGNTLDAVLRVVEYLREEVVIEQMAVVQEREQREVKQR